MILAELQSELALLGEVRPFSIAHRRGGAAVEYRGKVLTDFAHFDYLHLGASRELRKSVQQYLEGAGITPAAPRLLTGTTAPLESAEKAVAKFLGAERVIIFPSRTQAILSAVTAIANERDCFCIDELIQGPFSDAAFLVGAEVQSFSTVDVLSGLLERYRTARRRFIVVESLSPLTGALIDLSPYLILARRFNAEIIVDESYALGIIGPRGAGGGEVLVQSSNEPLSRNILMSIGDMSFGLCAGGAFLGGPTVVIEAIIQRSKALGYDSPLPAFFGPLIEKSLELVELSPLARGRVLDLSTKLRQGLPLNMVLSPLHSLTPIVSLLIPKFRKAQELAAVLFQRGLLADPLRRGTPLSEAGVLRFVVTSSLTERHIDDVLRILSEVLSKFETTP